MAVNPVGRYGIALTWNDGHKAGIYTFDNLRAMCQCFACTGKEPVQDMGPLLAEAPDVTAADLQAFLDRGKEKAARQAKCCSALLLVRPWPTCEGHGCAARQACTRR